MDPRRFDELTRAMAGATTRRGVLRGVAAGVAGALAGIRPGLAAKPNRSCVPGGGPCDANTPCCRGAVCAGGICCREARVCGDTCCSAESKCLDGACSDSGTGACPAGSVRVGPNCLLVAGQPCGQGAVCQSGFCTDDVCCDKACAGQCEACDATGQCLPVVGDPVNGPPACPSDGSICGGACDGSSPDCVFPAAGTECGPGTCEGPTLITSVCDGAGACVDGQPIDCSPFFCLNGACPPTCDEAGCVSAPCIDGVCCSDDDYCEGRCCSSDRASTEVCCPGTGQCCECFLRQEHGGGGRPPECCEPEKLCASLTNSPAGDSCCRGDETCVEGRCVWNAQVCEDRACPNLCCSGECCGPWETCGADGCERLAACTVDNEETACAGGGVCASINDGKKKGVCCPSNRVITFTDSSGGATGIYECCPFGSEPPHSDSTTCCFGPDYCRTSRGGFGRL